jgi:hypothetical protein
MAIADGLRAGRVRLPDRDAAILLDWADIGISLKLRTVEIADVLWPEIGVLS